GALPAPARPRRGAPLRDHAPPPAPQQVDDPERAGPRPRAGRDASTRPDEALRVRQEAPRRDRRGDRRRPRHRPGYGTIHRGGPARGPAVDTGREHDHGRDTGGLRPMMTKITECVLVTGMTGAGRSTAAKALEKLGYYVVDNLPPGMLEELVSSVDAAEDIDRLSVVVDSLSRMLFFCLVD